MFQYEKNRVKTIVFETALTFSKKLAEYSCRSVDPYFISDVYSTYKWGVDFSNRYLAIERYSDK